MRRSLLRRSPLEGLFRLQDELQRVYERPVDRWHMGVSGGGVFPPVNVLSAEDGYVIRMEIPGMSAGEISLQIEGQTLRVSGRRETADPSEGSAHRAERWSGEFSRAIQLPSDLDPQKAAATYRNGILEVAVPHREEAKPRKINVRAS